MSKSILQNGSEIASELRDSSTTIAPAPPTPRTLGDLLALWKENPPREDRMLRTTCVRLADYFQMPVEEISLNAVHERKRGFRPFLRSRKYGENSIRTYVNHLRLVLKYAEEAGWEFGESLSEEWRAVIALASEKRCADLATRFAAVKRSPREVTTEEVDQWVHQAAQERLSYGVAARKRFNFWRILRDCGYVKKLPLCLVRKQNYGIALKDFPPELKSEVIEMLTWKQATLAWGRPKGAQHRQVTAERLAKNICSMFGYAVNIRHESGISFLSQLIQPDIVRGYVEWSMNQRDTKGQTLVRNLRLVAAALGQHPSHASVDRKWMKSLIDNIPVDSKSVLKMRKAAKYLPYAIVQGIPARIREGRPAAAKRGRYELAILVRNELLIRWLTVLA